MLNINFKAEPMKYTTVPYILLEKRAGKLYLRDLIRKMATSEDILVGAFDWETSPEGSDFWFEVAEALSTRRRCVLNADNFFMLDNIEANLDSDGYLNIDNHYRFDNKAQLILIKKLAKKLGYTLINNREVSK